MKLSAALEYEKLRENPESWNKVIVHRDGKFFHIYNWSAWLIKHFVCTEEFQRERGDDKPIQANRYPSKHGEYVMLGFPLESISKYIPNYEEARKIEDTDDLEITVDADFGEATYENIQQAIVEWQATCPIKEKKGKSNAAITHSDGYAAAMAHSGLFGVAQKMMQYPLEIRTPMENYEFISQMKREIAAIL